MSETTDNHREMVMRGTSLMLKLAASPGNFTKELTVTAGTIPRRAEQPAVLNVQQVRQRV